MPKAQLSYFKFQDKKTKPNQPKSTNGTISSSNPKTFLNMPYIHIWISSSTESLFHILRSIPPVSWAPCNAIEREKIPRTQVLSRSISWCCCTQNSMPETKLTEAVLSSPQSHLTLTQIHKQLSTTSVHRPGPEAQQLGSTFCILLCINFIAAF